jgi:tetratricopeptide (TPR) repeat protein
MDEQHHTIIGGVASKFACEQPMTKENLLEILLINRQQIQENSYYGLDFLEEQNKELANETDEEIQLVLQFNNSLAQFYFHSNYQKALEICVTVINRYPDSSYTVALAQHHSFAGVCHTFLAQYDKAEVYLNKALELAEKVRDEKPNLVVSVLQSLFENSFYRKDAPEKSVSYLKKALAVLIENHDAERMCGCQLQLGEHYYGQGDYVTALSYFNSASTGFEDIMHLQNMAIAFSNIGMCYLKMGQLDRAEAPLQRALSICFKAATPDNTARCKFNLAQVYAARKDWIKALDFAQNSLSIFEDTGNRVEKEEVEQLLSRIAEQLQQA